MNCFTTCQTLSWPARLPDFSPIKYAWDMTGRQLHLPKNACRYLSRQLEQKFGKKYCWRPSGYTSVFIVGPHTAALKLTSTLSKFFSINVRILNFIEFNAHSPIDTVGLQCHQNNGLHIGRCRLRHLAMVQKDVAKSPRAAEQCDINIQPINQRIVLSRNGNTLNSRQDFHEVG
ncbi:hypothetical protein TNCV_2732811 [Trichonephila clavipes]|nr:hypothetical protein TNCV_2732811 [Trichonephila clavipes]